MALSWAHEQPYLPTQSPVDRNERKTLCAEWEREDCSWEKLRMETTWLSIERRARSKNQKGLSFKMTLEKDEGNLPINYSQGPWLMNHLLCRRESGCPDLPVLDLFMGVQSCQIAKKQLLAIGDQAVLNEGLFTKGFLPFSREAFRTSIIHNTSLSLHNNKVR